MANETRQNLMAGAFVISGVILAVVTLVIIQRLTLTPQATYQVRFTVEEGVGGISAGSTVQFGGLPRGTVTAVTPIFDGERLSAIEASIEIDKSIRFSSDATVLRMSPLLGNVGFLNFTNLGGGAGSTVVEPGGTIEASPSPGMLATIVGGENAADVGEVIENVQRLSVLLGDEVPKDYNEFVRPSLADVRTVVGDVDQRWPTWSGEVSTTLANAAQASASLVAGIDDAKALIDRAKQPVDGIAELVRNNTPTVDAILADAKNASEQVDILVKNVNEEAMPKLLGVLGSAQQSLDDVAAMLGDLRPELARQIPQVRSMLTDLREASSELKLSMIEIRRNPWRLLYQPTSEIVAHENLYDAARNFTIAAADLKVAGESLQQILVSDPQAFADDPDLARSIREDLGDQLQRYQQAQQDLFRIILAKP
jgi:ABC-type transporter Mla subunit MlaD